MDFQTSLKQLNSKTVLVVGLGGLGGYVTEFLARAGVGKLKLCDGDVFQESNLNRQLLCTLKNLGASKAETAKGRVHDISLAEVVAYHEFFSAENAEKLLDGVDIVADCLDNVSARRLLWAEASKRGITVVHSAIAGMTGQVAVIEPTDNFSETLYPEGGRIAYTTACCPATSAALQSSEIIKKLCGIGTGLSGEVLLFDLLENEFFINQL
jgi:molybdopterin/thiamine biosynthesis adenylyltransferase